MKKFILFLALALTLVFPNMSYANDQVENSKESEDVKKSEIETVEEVQPPKYTTDSKARPVPVLMFHDVGYVGVKEYSDANFIFKDNLERKLNILIDNGYTTITTKDLYDNWAYGKELPEKPVLLTFDDGYASHFTFVKNLLTRLKVKATFYIIQDRLEMRIYSRDLYGLKELYESGQEIGVHTYSHPDLTKLSYEEMYKEISSCKDFLESELDIKVDTFSYPFGIYNDEVIKAVKELGFKTAVTTKEGLGRPDQFNADNILKISRYNIYNSTSDQMFQKMLDGLK